MIRAVVGKPGAGKTHKVVCRICDELQAGKVVATNIKLRDGWEYRLARAGLLRRLSPVAIEKRAAELRSRFYSSPNIDDLLSIELTDDGESVGYLVIDEAHEELNSRTWSSEDRLRHVAWLSLSRQLGWDVDLVTQAFESLDKQLRDRVEFIEQLRNLKRVRVCGIPLSPVHLFLSITVWHGGPSVKRHVQSRRLQTLDWRSNLYDTHARRRAPEGVLAGRTLTPMPRPVELRPVAPRRIAQSWPFRTRRASGDEQRAPG